MVSSSWGLPGQGLVKHKLVEIGILPDGRFNDCSDVFRGVILQPDNRGSQKMNPMPLEFTDQAKDVNEVEAGTVEGCRFLPVNDFRPALMGPCDHLIALVKG